jgi:hypothetical protein
LTDDNARRGVCMTHCLTIINFYDLDFVVFLPFEEAITASTSTF